MSKEITLTRNALMAAMKTVAPAVGKEHPFNMVRLESVTCGEGSVVSLTTTNGDIQIEWRQTLETAGESLTFILNAQRFAAFVNAMQGVDVTVERAGKSKVRIDCGDASFGLAIDDDAVLPILGGQENTCAAKFFIEAKTMKEMLRNVKFAICKDESRPAVIRGVHVKLAKDVLTLEATDGRMAARVQGTAECDASVDGSFILTRKSVDILYGLLDESDECILINSDGKMARFTADAWALGTRLVAGTYPELDRVFQMNTNHAATLERGALISAINQAVLAAGDEGIVKLTLKAERSTVEGQCDIATAKVETKCTLADDDATSTTIHLTARLLKGLIDSIDDDTVTIRYSDGEHPIKLLCSIPWLAVLMTCSKNKR